MTAPQAKQQTAGAALPAASETKAAGSEGKAAGGAAGSGGAPAGAAAEAAGKAADRTGGHGDAGAATGRGLMASASTTTVSTSPWRISLTHLMVHGTIFGALSGAVFLGLGVLCYKAYGEPFLREAFLHHLTRKDPRWAGERLGSGC